MTTVCVRWNKAALQAVRVTHPGPPIVARALAVVHTAMYDAWAAYDDRAVGTRLGELLRRPPAQRTTAHKREADASIACWAAKRAYDYVRPVTAIHHLFAGQQVRAWAGPGHGTALIDGADWQPYQASTVVTPPFAEYYSGHSVFSAAAAEVLRRFTGSDAFGSSVTVEAGSSRVEPGLVPAQDTTLTWDTFSAAADQAGLSRRYGGIHFEDGDRAGRALGRILGACAWRLARRYRRGQV